MSEAKTYTLDEAHRYFGKALNGEVWELLQKPGRSEADNERMLYAAYASCYHWLNAGTGVHHQRAEWLIAHVYTELGMANSALRHASRCLTLTNEFTDLMEDFDRAYAYEGIARANALAGNRHKALAYIRLAREAGEAIKNDEDRQIFLNDFEGGNWHGLR